MIRFTLNSHNRTVADWRRPLGRSPWINARNHAAEYGAAGVFRADGSFRLFYRDSDTVRQRTFSQAAPA